MDLHIYIMKYEIKIWFLYLLHHLNIPIISSQNCMYMHLNPVDIIIPYHNTFVIQIHL